MGPWISLVAVLCAALLGAVGPHLFKAGADRARPGVLGLFANPWVWAGMGCYVLVMLLFTYAFRRGGTVAVLYPVYATTFVWAALLGVWLGGPPIRAVHVIGMLLLVAGVACLAAPAAPR